MTKWDQLLSDRSCLPLSCSSHLNKALNQHWEHQSWTQSGTRALDTVVLVLYTTVCSNVTMYVTQFYCNAVLDLSFCLRASHWYTNLHDCLKNAERWVKSDWMLYFIQLHSDYRFSIFWLSHTQNWKCMYIFMLVKNVVDKWKHSFLDSFSYPSLKVKLLDLNKLYWNSSRWAEFQT